MTWTEETTIAYAPNKKSGKSFERYGKYMKGRTVGEALDLGSLGLDLLFDFEKGLLWSTGGPKRAKPPDVQGMAKEELKKLCKTDLMLGKMYAKWKMWKTTFQALEENGMTRHDLKELNQDVEGGTDSIVVAIGRRKAQQQAAQILEAAKAEGDRPITDEEVLGCLQLWGFKENMNRGNVMPEGSTFVNSDTVGLIKMSTCERTLLTVGTKRYPEFTLLITKWLRDRMPEEIKHNFGYTSININKNYAGRLHRDGNNAGPSLIKAFGEFCGGDLNYWPSDDKKLPLEDFDESNKVTINIQNNLLLFDGNRGHCVNSFQGERYSLVFFSLRTWNKVPEEDLEEARRCGVPVPTVPQMTVMQQLLGPSGEAGYRAWPQDSSSMALKPTRADDTSTPQRKRSCPEDSVGAAPGAYNTNETKAFSAAKNPRREIPFADLAGAKVVIVDDED